MLMQLISHLTLKSAFNLQINHLFTLTVLKQCWNTVFTQCLHVPKITNHIISFMLNKVINSLIHQRWQWQTCSTISMWKKALNPQQTDFLILNTVQDNLKQMFLCQETTIFVDHDSSTGADDSRLTACMHTVKICQVLSCHPRESTWLNVTSQLLSHVEWLLSCWSDSPMVYLWRELLLIIYSPMSMYEHKQHQWPTFQLHQLSPQYTNPHCI